LGFKTRLFYLFILRGISYSLQQIKLKLNIKTYNQKINYFCSGFLLSPFKTASYPMVHKQKCSFIAFTCFLFFIPLSVIAQNTWQSWLHISNVGDPSYLPASIAMDNNNKIILATNGGTFSPVFDLSTFGNNLLAKMDTNYRVNWAIPARCYGQGLGGASPNAKICTDKSGNIYWAGSFYDSVVIKQTKLIGRATPVTPGAFQTTKNIYVVKVSPAGDVLWGNVFTAEIKSMPYDFTPSVGGLSADTLGNVYVCGSYGGTLRGDSASVTGSTMVNGYLLKLNSATGKLKKMLSLGQTNTFATKVKTDSKGNVVVVGYFGGTFNLGSFSFSGNSNSAFIAKLDANMSPIWVKQNTLKTCTSMDINEKDHIYITGSSSKGFYIAQYAPDGTLLKTKEPDALPNEVTPHDIIAYRDAVVATGDFRGTLQMDGKQIAFSGTGENALFTVVLDTTFNVKKLNSVSSWGISRGTSLTKIAKSGQFVLAYTFNRFVVANGFIVNALGYDLLLAIDKDFITRTSTTEEVRAKIYPNPANQQVMVETQLPISCKIHNNVGVLVKEGKTNTPISTDDLPNGCYFIRLADASGQQGFFKFVVAR
jgi:Secretion system C-terminal sorting domain